MRSPKSREVFLKLLTVGPKQLILPEQVHGNKVVEVSEKRKDQTPGSDGLVSRDDSVVLGVLAADCVPLMFVDPKKRIAGVAHAGWRGTLANIAANTVEAMKALGSHPEDVMVSIGPHIGACCYDVPKERALKFQHRFGKTLMPEGKDHWQIDLGKANVLSLTKAGILPKHIKQSAICTCCDQDYFSYRRDTKETFGEIMGVIVWK